MRGFDRKPTPTKTPPPTLVKGSRAAQLVDQTLRSPGKPLDRGSFGHFDPRFDWVFNQVRLHTDPMASESARAVRARAYTVGRHIIVHQDHFAPETTTGRELLAHELAHAVQQSQVTSTPPVDALPIVPAQHPSEAAADRQAGAAMKGRAMEAPTPIAAALQRRVVCDGAGGCWEEPDDASGLENHTRAAVPNMSHEPSRAQPRPGSPSVASTPLATYPLATYPLATYPPLVMASVTPTLPPPMGPNLPPPTYTPPDWGRPGFSVPMQAPPSRTPASEPPSRTPASEPPSRSVGSRTGGGIGGVVVGLSGTAISSFAAGLAVFLWPRSTASPWEDTINPVTGGPWRDRLEYEEYYRLPPVEQQRRIREAGNRSRRPPRNLDATPQEYADHAPLDDPNARRRTCVTEYPNAQTCVSISDRLYSSVETALRGVQAVYPAAVPGNVRSATGNDCRQPLPNGHIGVYTTSGPGAEYAGTIFGCACCDDGEGSREPVMRRVYSTNVAGATRETR